MGEESGRLQAAVPLSPLRGFARKISQARLASTSVPWLGWAPFSPALNSLTIAAGRASAGNSISSASSDSVTSVGVPKTVIVLMNEMTPESVLIWSGVA